MFEFRLWLEDDPSEYDPPDEKEMDRIRNTPLRCDSPPDLRGDRYRFRMPMGEIHDFVVKYGGIIGLNAAQGSLNAKCFKLKRNGDCKGLYKLLQYVANNHNPIIRRQIVGA